MCKYWNLLLVLVGFLPSNTISNDVNDNGFAIISTTEASTTHQNTLLEKLLSQLVSNEKQILQNQKAFENCWKKNETHQPFNQDQNQLKEEIKKLNESLLKSEEKYIQLGQRIEKVSRQNDELERKLLENEKKITGIQKQLSVAEKLNEEFTQQLKIMDIQKLPKDCLEIKEKGIHTSGVFYIQSNSRRLRVKCDMNSKGGGWTLFHNRFDGSLSFDRNYTEYKVGFGNISGEFWLGLEHLYQLIGAKNRTISSELLIQLVSRNGTEFYAHYHDFTVENEALHYYISPPLSEYDGNAGNALKAHIGWFFSENRFAYASAYGGCWWYCSHKDCMTSNLNGRYFFPNQLDAPKPGMMWGELGPHDLKAARMMIRRKRPNSGVLR